MIGFDELKIGTLIARREDASLGEIIAHKPYKITGNNGNFIEVINECGDTWEINKKFFKITWYICEQSEDDKFRELLLDA